MQKITLKYFFITDYLPEHYRVVRTLSFQLRNLVRISPWSVSNFLKILAWGDKAITWYHSEMSENHTMD